MSKIVLDSVASGYDLSKVNANFQKIEDELNNRVLYREPSGEPNTLEENIDCNNKFLYNVPIPTSDFQAVPKKYVDDEINPAASSIVAATAANALAAQQAATSATASAAAAATSETNAAISEGLAFNYAQLANLTDYGSVDEAVDYTTDYGVLI